MDSPFPQTHTHLLVPDPQINYGLHKPIKYKNNDEVNDFNMLIYISEIKL